MKKKIVLLVMLLLLVVGGALVGIYWDPIIDWLPIDQSGWDVLDNGGQCYLDEDGDPITGWQVLDGNTYYFDLDSFAMKIRWITLEDGRYYLGDDGIRRTGWQTINGKNRYFSETGAMRIGWLEHDDESYYMLSNGVAATGLQEIGGELYIFGDDGVLITEAQYELDGHHYCIDSFGKAKPTK